MTQEEERIRGEQARQIIESPIWKEAWDEFEQSVLKKWRNEPNIETAGREALWLSLRIADKARKNIERVMQTGQMANRQLEEMING